MATVAKTAIQSAVVYPKFRPAAPSELVKRVVSFLNEKVSTPFDTAVDVGCGSGKSTEVLSPYFKNVIGFDSTDVKNNYAFKREGIYNVIYRNGSPEGIGCFDASVQLVTASQCAHWFNLNKFYEEVERILVPGGVLSIYGYTLPTISSVTTGKVNQLIEKFMFETLGDYMPPQSRKLYNKKYKTSDFDTFFFNKEPLVRDDNSYVELRTTVSGLVDYIRSTSTVQNYQKIHGEKDTHELIDNFENELLNTLSSSKHAEDTPINIVFHFVSLLGRKPF